MSRFRRGLLIALGIALAVIAGLAAITAVVIGARTRLPSWMRETVESAASRALGRELAIGGPFDLAISLTPRVVAHDVTVANLPWGTEASMFRTERATVTFDLASLWSGPLRVRELVIEEARLLLETDGAGNGNWNFAPSGGPSDSTAVPLDGFERAVIRRLELVYRPRPESEPTTLGVEELEARLDPATRRLEIEGSGEYAETPWRLAGQLGKVEMLLAGHDIDADLTGSLGETRIGLRGRLRDPLVPGGPGFDLSLDGPDIAAAMAPFGLRPTMTGVFGLRGRFTPGPEGIGVDLEGRIGEVRAQARGRVGSLTALDGLDVALEGAGPDASVVGSWIGARGLPPRPFDLAGRLRREGGRLFLENVKGEVGTTSLLVVGELGAPPRFEGTNLAVEATGRNLAELAPLARLRLPPGAFELTGRFLRRADGLAIEDAELRSGGARLRASGALGEPPRCLDLDLSVEAAGPDLEWFSGVATVDLPPGPFEMRGRVARDGPALELDALEGRLGAITVGVAGRMGLAKRLSGSDFRMHLEGPDSGELAALAKLGGVPAKPFDVKGRLRIEEAGFELSEVEAGVGRLAASLEGRIGRPSARDGTVLSGSVRGPALAELAGWGLPAGLPDDPFTVAGRIGIDLGVLSADSVVANVGADRAGVDGVLGPLSDLGGLSALDAAVRLSGPDLAGLGRFFAAAGLAEPAWLPRAPYELAGRVRHSPTGYELSEVTAEVGETRVRLDSAVGAGPHGLGTDLRFDAAGPDASLLAALAGTPFPSGEFAAQGQIARVDAGWKSDGLAVTIGEAHVEVAGRVGAWPGLADSDLRIALTGPDLDAALGAVTGLANLPAAAFELSAEIAGSHQRLVSRRFSARIGESRLEGSLALRLDGRTFVEADLRASRLDMPGLLAGFGAEVSAIPAPGPGHKPAIQRERLFSDEPLRLGLLRTLDAALRLESAEMTLAGLELHDVVVAGELRDGALRIDRFEGTGSGGGHATANGTIEPLDEGYRLRGAGRIDGGRLILPKTEKSPGSTLPIDLEFDLAGEGRSPHELATGSDGRLLLVVGSANIPITRDARLASDTLTRLLDALNPFRRSSEFTAVECGVVFVRVKDGRAAVEPIAARTDKLTLVGHGGVDFDTEAIDLYWTLKPRQGLGISAGSITNPYIHLGGTLASPSLDLDPLKAVTSTGAAVASAGLTILSKGLYYRITAEQKVCKEALANARRQIDSSRR